MIRRTGDQMAAEYYATGKGWTAFPATCALVSPDGIEYRPISGVCEWIGERAIPGDHEGALLSDLLPPADFEWVISDTPPGLFNMWSRETIEAWLSSPADIPIEAPARG